MHRLKRIPKTLLAAAAMLAFSCSSQKTANFGTPRNLLSYGVYSAQDQDADGMMVKLSLNQSGTYSKKKFKGVCLLVENKGEWKSESESYLDFHLQEVRKRNDCSSEEWQVEKQDKTSQRMIRNVTTNSFEILDQEEQTSAEWQKFVKR